MNTIPAMLAIATDLARHKHPEFVYNALHFWCAVVEEVLEWLWAKVFQGKHRACEEWVDVLVLFERRRAGDMVVLIPWWDWRWVKRAWRRKADE